MSIAAHLRIAVLVVASLIAAGSEAGMSVRNTSALDDILGDANCSGAVDPVDALAILRGEAGLAAPPCVDLADVQCDGDVDTIDALQILRFNAGLSVVQESGCPSIGETVGPPPSSFDLIDQAVLDGSIDDETGLIYKVYTVFGDDRLPGQYKGDDSGGPKDSFIITDVQSQFDTLSPEAQAILRPFLIPPIYMGSWASPQGSQLAGLTSAGDPEPLCNELAPGWQSYDASTANVRFWWQTKYPQDEQWAKDIATAMDEKIWPALTSLMGEPLPDDGYECNGGSGSLDVYLALEGDQNLTPGYGCEKAPAYIELNRLTPSPRSDLTHEFMHAIQWGYDAKDGCVFDLPPGGYRWLGEATAVWAEDFVYPDRNEEWPEAGAILSHPELPLETFGGQHEYGAYLFFLFLTKVYNSSSPVRDVWDKAAEYDSLEALENALPDGFEGRWPRFALCNWNRPPADCYKQWDDLDQGVADSVKPTHVSLGGEAKRSFQVAAGVEHLAASYTHFVFDDDNVRSVVFYNTLADFPHAGVQALVKVNGQWQGADYWNWTHEPTKGFCRDIDGQHIEELVIVISNSDWTKGPGLHAAPNPRLEARSAVCTAPDWVGTASVEIVQDGVTYAASASNLRFERSEPDNTGGWVEYTLTESSAVNWSVSGTQTSTGCAASGDMAVQPANGTMGDGRVWGHIWVDFEAGEYEGSITAYNSEAVQTWACPNELPQDTAFGGDGLIMDAFGEGFAGLPITEDGFLAGEYSAFGHHHQWHLEPAPPLDQP